MVDYRDRIINGPRTLSVGEYYLTRLEEHPGDKVAMAMDVGGSELTYAQLLRRSKAVSGLLRSHGVQAKDTVMVLCGNTLEFAPVMLGTLLIGAAVAPVNPIFDKSDLVHLLGVNQPQLVISNKLAEPCIKEALAAYKTPVALLTMEAVTDLWEDDRYMKDFHLGLVEDTDTHVALVLCSSGTTGKPKGIEVTHLRLLCMQYINLYPEYEPGSEMVILNKINPFWGQYHYTAMFALCAGHKLVQTESFQQEKFFATIQQFKINLCFTGTPELIGISSFPSSEEYDLSSLRDVVFWGSTVRQSLLDTAANKLRCPITNVYGMSECCGMLRPAYEVRDKPGNVGKLGDNVKFKVVDLESGKTLGPNCPGELRFLAWTCFKAYRNNPQATQDMFDAEGYLCTGDLGYYDEDGYFYIVDRIKEIFKYNFFNVYPSEIEDVLTAHPAVLEAAVVGIKYEVDIDHARAFVVLRPGATASEEELLSLVRESFPSYKWLHGGVNFMDALPRTATGKVKTYKLRQSLEIS